LKFKVINQNISLKKKKKKSTIPNSLFKTSLKFKIQVQQSLKTPTAKKRTESVYVKSDKKQKNGFTLQ